MPENKISLKDLDSAPSNLPATLIQFTNEEHLSLLKRFSDVSTEKAKLEDEYSLLIRKWNTSQILDDLIKPYANRAFIFMCIYCSFVAATLVAAGFNWQGFRVEASVLGYLVGSTAVTVIGLVGMVLTGIFVGARKLSR